MNPYAKYLGNRLALGVAAFTPARVAALIRELCPRQLAKRPAPDKWSIREISSRLTETEMVMCCRARWMAFEDHPTLVLFDPEKWARGWEREKEPLEEMLERFRLPRRSHVRLFRSLANADFKRTGLHSERGIISLKVQLETLAGHDLNHLEQIRRLAARHRKKG